MSDFNFVSGNITVFYAFYLFKFLVLSSYFKQPSAVRH